MNLRQIAKRQIEKYNVKSQINQTKEELAELIVALSHWERSRSSKEEVLEEIADVIIMIEQLKIIFGDDLVDKWVIHKSDKIKKGFE